MNIVKWGIVGTGYIADIFAEDMTFVKNGTVVAVCSRSEKNAADFAEKYEGITPYWDYAAFLEDETIDAVYVASPHPAHKEQAMKAIEAGKAVLCEKPITMNYEDTKTLVSFAKEKGVLLMEGMWTRFLPAVAEAKKLIDDGVIGSVRLLEASFGFNVGDNYPIDGRLLNPDLGGGARLDVGIYPISLAHYIFGKMPMVIQASEVKTSTGVDGISSYIFTYDDALAILHSAVIAETPQHAVISGEKGFIRIPKFWMADRYILSVNNEEKEFVFEREHKGYVYEIEAFDQALINGKKEVEQITPDESLEIMKIMDDCSLK